MDGSWVYHLLTLHRTHIFYWILIRTLFKIRHFCSDTVFDDKRIFLCNIVVEMLNMCSSATHRNTQPSASFTRFPSTLIVDFKFISLSIKCGFKTIFYAKKTREIKLNWNLCKSAFKSTNTRTSRRNCLFVSKPTATTTTHFEG